MMDELTPIDRISAEQLVQMRMNIHKPKIYGKGLAHPFNFDKKRPIPAKQQLLLRF